MKAAKRVAGTTVVLGALALSTAPSALATTYGDLNATVTYSQGPGADQQTVTVQNTGTPSQIISDVTFKQNATVPITGATTSFGDQCQISGSPSNTTFCGHQLDPGKTESITITTNGSITGQPGGQITMGDSGDNPQGPFGITGPAPASKPCSLNPKVQAPCTDVAIASVQIGKWFSRYRDGGVILDAPFVGTFFDIAAEASGFQPLPKTPRFQGEQWDIAVTVTNHGPSAATFDVKLVAPLHAVIRYGGIDTPEKTGRDRELDPRRLTSLAAGESATLIYFIAFGDAGKQTVTASDFNVKPTDPISNDTGSVTATILPSAKFSGVGYHLKRAGADIIGHEAATTGQVRDSRRSARTAAPVEIAVLRLSGAACSWLTGASAQFSPSSPSECDKPSFHRVTGTTQWGYHLTKRLPKGTYHVLVRDRGQVEFAPSLHNFFTITA